MRFSRSSLSHLLLGLLTAASLALPSAVTAGEAGLRQYTVAASASSPEAIPVLLYYPTQAPARAIPMGPFTVHVAMQAPPDAKFKGLILLSHGTRGPSSATAAWPKRWRSKATW